MTTAVAALAIAAATALPDRGGPGTASVRRGDLVLVAEVEGELVARDAEQLGPPQLAEVWDFKISFLAPEGAEVRQGDRVLGFDASELERRLAERRGEAEQAEERMGKRGADLEQELLDADLELAKAESELRRRQLAVEVPPELVAARELAKARVDLAAAERKVGHLRAERDALEARGRAEVAQLRHRHRAARADVESLESAIAAMTVAAPRDGTVVYVADWRGEKPRVGESTWRAEKLLSIPDLTRLAAVARVPETELGRVDEGMPVRLRLDAHPDVEYRGTVLRLSTTVGAQARNDPRKVARADIELERIDPERMRPGMRFRAEIERERMAGVLSIPLDAVLHDEEGAYVLRRTWRGSERVEPRFGRRSADEVEVLDGLDAGDRVVLDPREEAR